MNPNIEPRIASTESRGRSVLKNLSREFTIRTHLLRDLLPNLRGPRTWVTVGTTSAAVAALIAPAPEKPAFAQFDGDEIIAGDPGPGMENTKAVNEAPADKPVSGDLFCVEEGTGRWIVENPVCGAEPIDESRNPGALVAPAVSAAAPVSGSIPHNARYGDNPGLWTFPEPANMPVRIVQIWGPTGYGYREPGCIYSTSESDKLDDFRFVEKGKGAPAGDTIRIGIIFQGYSQTLKKQKQTRGVDIGDINLIYATPADAKPGGFVDWSDHFGVRDAQRNFRKYHFQKDPEEPSWSATGQVIEGKRQPMPEGDYYWRLHYISVNGDELVAAEVSCSVRNNPDEIKEPRKPLFVGGTPKWVSGNGAPPGR